MLNKLSIKNVALIDEAEIDFTDGFNVMSGETGSGKSVIIESLNFVLGAKADKNLIGGNADYCFVCAEFDVSDNAAINDVFDELEFDKEDVLIISRRLSHDGKNSVKVNGNAVTLSMLKRFTTKLVDVHGQSEHYELLAEGNQLKLVDCFGGESVIKLKTEISAVIDEYKEVKNSLESLGGDESRRLLRLDVLDFQIKEITDCDLKEGEEEELSALKEKLLNQERIATALASVKAALTDEGGANDVIGNAVRCFSGVSSFGGEYSALSDRLNSLYAEAEDIADTAGSLLEEFEYSDMSLDEVEARLDCIKKIKRKYGDGYEEINAFLADAESERDKLLHFNELAEELLKRKKLLESSVYEKYKALSVLRRKLAEDFSVKVKRELTELGMDKAEFSIDFNEFPAFEQCKFGSREGVDSVSFMFSANLGEAKKPLSDVISGGELSRFMLAVKAQSAKFDSVSTYIFDEIDAGISGKVASVVAEKLYKISLGVQVIAITHLPQISAFSDNAVYISKSVKGDKTVTSVKILNEREKVDEIIRLVGGTSDNAAAREHSENIIKAANEKKALLKANAKV